MLSSCGVARAIAVLCGCAVRQDGRSASLTAPNGSAQRTLLTGALGRASLTASEVVGLELHGTGTALGDPTEAGALASVHGVRLAAATVGGGKANVGHSEAASGLHGMLQALRSLCVQRACGNAHLRLLNPLVRARLDSLCDRLALPTQEVRSACTGARGVSSFGFYVHARLLVSAPLPATGPAAGGTRVALVGAPFGEAAKRFKASGDRSR